jgi:hypothetical protein
VLVDGFKRLHLAREMGLTHLWVQTAPLDAAHAKAAILQCNQPRQGLSKLEEAWIVHSLCREQGLMQTQVAQLLRRDKSWVCRRMKLAQELDENLQNQVRLGLLPVTIACEVSRLQRCNQSSVAQAVGNHQLSSRESSRLVQRLRNARKPEDQAVCEMLQDPWRYIGAAETGARHAGDDDPRLTDDGNRLRRSLLSWQDICGQLTRKLRRVGVADVRVLAPLLRDAVITGAQALRELEAAHSSCSAQSSPTQDQRAGLMLG